MINTQSLQPVFEANKYFLLFETIFKTEDGILMVLIKTKPLPNDPKIFLEIENRYCLHDIDWQNVFNDISVMYERLFKNMQSQDFIEALQVSL